MDPQEFVVKCNAVREEWVRLDSAARGLEELRTIKRSEIANQRKADGESATAAQQYAEGSSQYRAHVENMVKARTEANKKRAEVKGMEMKWDTWRSMNATRRAEMSLV